MKISTRGLFVVAREHSRVVVRGVVLFERLPTRASCCRKFVQVPTLAIPWWNETNGIFSEDKSLLGRVSYCIKVIWKIEIRDIRRFQTLPWCDQN